MNSQNLNKAQDIFMRHGINEHLFNTGEIRISTLMYNVYWMDRLKNNVEEQNNIKNNFNTYLKNSGLTANDILHTKDYAELVKLSSEYVATEIVPVQTVDLIIEKANSTNQDSSHREVLLFERQGFPKGISLPGGLVEDSDEQNILNIDQKTFAALRVAAEKVLYLDKNERHYKTTKDENGNVSYSVENSSGTKKIIIHPTNIYGYSIKENLKSVIRPSDPRHLVDTIGFNCEIIDEDNKEKEYFWESKKNLLDNNLQHTNKHFAFNHHKEIIFHTLAKTSVENDMHFSEINFIKEIINNPLESYQEFSSSFNSNTSFPKLFPTVNKILKELFSDDINKMCEDNEILIGFRDKVVNSLRHVSLKNRTFCPYLPTVQAIFKSIAFFDVVARQKKEFYNDINPNEIIEHNPREKTNAAYHMYKYEYRMDELMGKIPDEIIIPTFANLSATDLMKVRGVPIRFVGLSKDFIYVDEFEQSPEEFLMHDINHSYRMSEEDDKYMEKNNMSRDEFLAKQNAFIKEYLPTIKIAEKDNEKSKEIKKIKKIILFEIFHEDAKPFLPEIVLQALTRKEGGETKFELPVVDEKTHYMDIVDVLDTEISTLSYVRNKLQCGFYDKVDKQNSQIVNPQYRKSSFIAEAAFDMLHEISIMAKKEVTVDYEYILKRVCSVGPNNIYEPVIEDENLKKYSDGAEFLNPKRYQSNQQLKVM